MVQFLEVIGVQIGKEAGRAGLLLRDFQVVDVGVPVGAHLRASMRTSGEYYKNRVNLEV